MTAPPLKGGVLNCSNKHRWSDEHAARAGAMDSITRHGQASRLWVYHCPHCRGWHLTSQNQGVKMLVTRDNLVHVRINR